MSQMVSRMYANFRGVDFRGEDINFARSPDSKNVWKDYRKIDSIRTRPGMKLVQQASGAICGLYFFKGELLALIQGKGLYRLKTGRLEAVYTSNQVKAGTKTNVFVFDDVLYIMGNGHHYKYTGESAIPVDCYVPTTTIGRKPSGGGTIHEDVNLATYRRKNTFLADDVSTEFYLDAQNIDEVHSVKVNGNEWLTKEYTVDKERGCVVFAYPPPPPSTDGQDNVEVEFSKIHNGRDKILNSTICEVFDNRVFVGGNPDYPNTIWHCSINDPSYFSDLDYYKEGLDEARVTGMVAGNNALWVFREPSPANTTVFYHVPTIDADYGKIYPSQHSSVATGCIGGAINFNDDIVFFSDRGMEGISGDITTEQVVAHRSTLVDRKLNAEKKYREMILAEWEGYLVVFMGNKAYLADSRAMLPNENHTEYEWFYWELEKDVTCAVVHEGVLYVGTRDGGIYSFTDEEAAVESYWTTPKDKFNFPHKLKTSNKRGCVAEATGDIQVYAKVEDTDYELIGEYKDVEDYFVSRIKRKKFKDIQLKFYSQTRFSLETVTLECFIGGYIKR